jgi:hypothetical protein
MTFAFHLVIPHPSESRVLLVEDGAGWALPRATGREPFLALEAAAGIRERVGLDVALLRSAFVVYDTTNEGSGDAFFFTENLTGRSPRLGEWCGEDALAGRAMSDERDREVIRQWFTERRDGKPARLQPWQHEGWLATAVSWIRSTLPGVAGVAQYYTWSGSAVLRVEADGRRYYFKAAPDFFPQEAAMTAMLAERFPEVIPAPVAIDDRRGWMVLEDFGDAFVGGLSLEHWEAALDSLLAIQRSSVPLVGSLLEAGCVDRRPPALATQIEDLVEGKLGELPAGMADRLRVAVPRLRGLCAELAGSPIPSTLVHGDFHANNVVFKDGRHLIFDWTDASIAHPFVDLATFFYMFGPALTDVVVRDRLRDRYLDGWSDLMPRHEALVLFERTEPVAAMYHAITYQRILEALETSERGEWESHLPWWLTRALESPFLLTR